MNKLFNLRDTLLNSGLTLSSENLTTLVKGGKVEHHYNRDNDHGNHKFKKTYDAQILVIDYAGDENAVIYIIAQWLTKNQPGHASDAVSYELDILNHDSADLLITVKGLSETVTPAITNKGVLIDACPPEHLDNIARAEGIANVTGEVSNATG